MEKCNSENKGVTCNLDFGRNDDQSIILELNFTHGKKISLSHSLAQTYTQSIIIIKHRNNLKTKVKFFFG